MNIVALCNTPFQILVALSLKLNYYRNDSFDLVITGAINNYKEICKNAEKLNLFNNVIEIFERVYKYNYIYKIARRFCTLNKKLARAFIKKYYPDIRTDYQQINFYGIGNIQTLWNIFAFGQKNIPEINRFEEGVLINSPSEATAFKFRNTFSNIILHYDYIQRHISKQLTFNIEALAYSIPFQKKQINLWNDNPEEFKKNANILFNYTRNDVIKEKFIFFDQNLQEISLDFDKLGILAQIRDCVGKENLLVKLHPRHNTQEYKNDFKINKKTNIPWEIFLLNEDMSKKILIGIASSSLVHPQYYFQTRMRVISLLAMADTMYFEKHKDYQYLMDAYFTKYKEIYFLPKTLEELKKYLQNIELDTVEKE
ncbi:MAG: hypothetical protein ACTTKD_07930 [Peptoanaerobacter stomatis]|uniref:hypothetical protein n=1 Tax=Peptoanaerobacter stomatis TaxID=796937 RepID=UPI003FA10F07